MIVLIIFIYVLIGELAGLAFQGENVLLYVWWGLGWPYHLYRYLRQEKLFSVSIEDIKEANKKYSFQIIEPKITLWN